MNASMTRPVSRVMSMRIVSLIARCETSAVVAEERHEQEAEHVKGGDERGQQAERPNHLARSLRIGLPEDFVFAMKTGQRPNTCDGNGPYGHRPEGPRNLFAQAAHLSHVLFAAEGVDDRSGAEEEQ